MSSMITGNGTASLCAPPMLCRFDSFVCTECGHRFRLLRMESLGRDILSPRPEREDKCPKCGGRVRFMRFSEQIDEAGNTLKRIAKFIDDVLNW